MTDRSQQNKSLPADELGRAAQPGFEQDPPPEATNHDHPGAINAREAVPGAGIARAGADAGPVEGGPEELRNRPYPGSGADACTPAAAPGAMRPGTTVSGIKSVPSSGGFNAPTPGGRATEASPSTPSGTAPFDLPTGGRGEPEGSGEILAPELADPNFTRREQQQRFPNEEQCPGQKGV